MSKVSCFQRIKLQRNYRLAVQSTPLADPCDSAFRFAVVRALYSLNNSGGNTEAEIRDTVLGLCPDATDSDFDNAFAFAKRAGIVRLVIPSRIDWIGPRLPDRYVLSATMDARPGNSAYVIYLLQLVGGFSSPFFVHWFEPYSAPTVQNFELDPCAA